MADLRLLPAGISDERGRVLLALIERLGELDLRPLLVYRLDGADDDVLRCLAWQFHMMGDEGFNLAQTTEQLRDLVRRAIELNRYRGTRWAVRQALQSIGYPDAEILEKPDLLQEWFDNGGWLIDGSETLDGDHLLSADGPLYLSILARHWATYDVRVNLDPDNALEPASQQALRRIVVLHAPARSHLLILIYRLTSAWLASILHNFTAAIQVSYTACRQFAVRSFQTIEGCGLIDGEWSLDGGWGSGLMTVHDDGMVYTESL